MALCLICLVLEISNGLHYIMGGFNGEKNAINGFR